MTNTKEGLLLFAADHEAANMIIETLLSTFEEPVPADPNLTKNLPYAQRTDVDTPVQLASILAIRVQAIGLLDEVRVFFSF